MKNIFTNQNATIPGNYRNKIKKLQINCSLFVKQLRLNEGLKILNWTKSPLEKLP